MVTFFDEIRKFVGLDEANYIITNEFYAIIKGPHNRKIEVKVFGIANATSAIEDRVDPRFFVVIDGSYKWAEINKAEFKALGLLDGLKTREHIVQMEYDQARCEAVVIGKNSKITCSNVDTVDEFLQIVDAMDYIRNRDFYTRIKEAKHEQRI
nr:MAG TPA: hypothetical protein [Caudoviricetes sp.]